MEGFTHVTEGLHSILILRTVDRYSSCYWIWSSLYGNFIMECVTNLWGEPKYFKIFSLVEINYFPQNSIKYKVYLESSSISEVRKFEAYNRFIIV